MPRREIGLEGLHRYMVADLFGNPTPTIRFRRFPTSEYRPERAIDLPSKGRTPLSDSVAEHREIERRERLLCEGLAEFVSEDNLRMLRGVLVHAKSLRELAREEGRKVQALSQRMKRLRAKFPELEEWWLQKFGKRQRKK